MPSFRRFKCFHVATKPKTSHTFTRRYLEGWFRRSSQLMDENDHESLLYCLVNPHTNLQSTRVNYSQYSPVLQQFAAESQSSRALATTQRDVQISNQPSVEAHMPHQSSCTSKNVRKYGMIFHPMSNFSEKLLEKMMISHEMEFGSQI